jgi:hypothetical protein
MMFGNFEENQWEVILKALLFSRDVVEKHYAHLAEPVTESDRQPIWDELNKIVTPINDTITFFKENKMHLITMRDTDFSYFMDTIRSSLELYRQYLEKTFKLTGVIGYADSIRKVEEIASLDGPSKGKSDVFLKYYVGEQNLSNGIKVFISYQDKDVERACQLKSFLINNSTEIKERNVFVAHRDIPLTEEWRKIVKSELENSSHLIALCTENYMCSAFGNQEVGYAIAKGEDSFNILGRCKQTALRLPREFASPARTSQRCEFRGNY